MNLLLALVTGHFTHVLGGLFVVPRTKLESSSGYLNVVPRRPGHAVLVPLVRFHASRVSGLGVVFIWTSARGERGTR